jgi:hypothetical protein
MRALLEAMNGKPLIVELVGPPGVGKSTLASALFQCNGKVRIDIFPYFRKIKHLPFFFLSLCQLLPTLLFLFYRRNEAWLTRRDIALMTILNGWHRELRQKGVDDRSILVLEEGAVCLLAKLHAFGSATLKGESAKIWWCPVYKQWAETLDFIIKLDTPLPILVKRIRARGMVHEIDGMTDKEALEYLECIQSAQGQVISNLTLGGKGPIVFTFNTEEKTPEQICSELFKTELM